MYPRTVNLSGKEAIMKKALQGIAPLLWALLGLSALSMNPAMYAENDVMGEIQFEGRSHVEKTSGV
jgi:hypothetical protein